MNSPRTEMGFVHFFLKLLSCCLLFKQKLYNPVMNYLDLSPSISIQNCTVFASIKWFLKKHFRIQQKIYNFNLNHLGLLIETFFQNRILEELGLWIIGILLVVWDYWSHKLFYCTNYNNLFSMSCIMFAEWTECGMWHFTYLSNGSEPGQCDL